MHGGRFFVDTVYNIVSYSIISSSFIIIIIIIITDCGPGMRCKETVA